jgi:starch phosphorylase
MINKEKYSIAYLSMEIALENNIKTYAGGLGVLAGDILKSAATRKFPLIGLTLLNKYGYFKQKINSSGNQIELIDRDFDFSLLKKLSTEVDLLIGEEKVRIGVWQYLIKGLDKFEKPKDVIFVQKFPETETGKVKRNEIVNSLS